MATVVVILLTMVVTMVMGWWWGWCADLNGYSSRASYVAALWLHGVPSYSSQLNPIVPIYVLLIHIALFLLLPTTSQVHLSPTAQFCISLLRVELVELVEEEEGIHSGRYD